MGVGVGGAVAVEITQVEGDGEPVLRSDEPDATSEPQPARTRAQQTSTGTQSEVLSPHQLWSSRTRPLDCLQIRPTNVPTELESTLSKKE